MYTHKSRDEGTRVKKSLLASTEKITKRSTLANTPKSRGKELWSQYVSTYVESFVRSLFPSALHRLPSTASPHATPQPHTKQTTLAPTHTPSSSPPPPTKPASSSNSSTHLLDLLALSEHRELRVVECRRRRPAGDRRQPLHPFEVCVLDRHHPRVRENLFFVPFVGSSKKDQTQRTRQRCQIDQSLTYISCFPPPPPSPTKSFFSFASPCLAS